MILPWFESLSVRLPEEGTSMLDLKGGDELRWERREGMGPE